MIKSKIFSTFLFAVISCVVFPTVAASPSQAQIEQFKRLPKAQQQALAKQYGVDINQLNGGSRSAQTQAQQPLVYPRGTQFDEQGNPIEPVELESSAAVDEEDDDTLKPFGYDLFAGSPSTFAPANMSLVPGNYIIGPGDKVNIQLYGKQDAEHEFSVTREGTIDFPSLGPVKVAGLTYSELKKFVKEEVKRQTIGVNVNVTLGELRSIQVFVLGEAHKPGAYTVSALSTMTHALFVNGGINEIGSLRNIQLKRAGQTVATLDLYDLLTKGDTSSDVRLQSGDVVFIPPVGDTVSVDGEVRRPAIYEIKGSETIGDLITVAGGFKSGAYPRQSVLERIDSSKLRKPYNLDLTNDSDLKRKVQDGDFLRVLSASSSFDSSITLMGAVTRPGLYAWSENMRISALIKSRTSDLMSYADLDYGLVVRELNVRGDIEVLQFSPGDVLSGKAGEQDYLLSSRDTIVLFSRYERKSSAATTLSDLAGTPQQLQKRRSLLLEERVESNKFWREYLVAFLGVDGSLQGQELEDEIQTKLSSMGIQESSLQQMVAGQADRNTLSYQDAHEYSRKRLLLPIVNQLQAQGRSGAPIQLVEVDGAVKNPGVYPLPANGRISDIVTAAGGLSESAFTLTAELARNRVENDFRVSIEHLSFNVQQALSGDDAQDHILQSKDRINIHHLPDYQEEMKVVLRGEVVFPGTYVIRRGETMMDVIKRAGGFTEYAHIDGSVFTRASVREQESKFLTKIASDLRTELAGMSLRSGSGQGQLVDYDQLQQLLNDITTIEPVGRMVVDIPALMEGNSAFNIALEPGDELVVPAFRNSLNVLGQVQLPITHLYDGRLTVDDYIARSGGLKKQADDDRIYVIRANGSVMIPEKSFWFSGSSSVQLAPGDTIVVPLDVEYMDNLTLWTNITQILYQTGVAVAAVASL
ncbi:SLBB domain-containing protein [Corallincola spongiicola]|uniref:Polysaccharide biosynthesis/export protein n=1 Tax=Corallincola spongiicola TaxID=2520508 RepID=A0ABY1WK89_9GAMM|nr:SLBB domain-containing protein [Corallincola spongiicola]TAA39580.1 polysaccharide biosynthesis/export protein [Corallincola spongiicola]